MGTKKQGNKPFSGKIGNKKSKETRKQFGFLLLFIKELVVHIVSCLPKEINLLSM